MEQKEQETFKKGFNHGYILSSVPSGGKVVEQLKKVADKGGEKSVYAKGFNSGIKQHQKEKTMSKGMSKLKESITKRPIKPITKKPPTKGR